VLEPAIPLGRPDDEWGVAHPQARVTPLLGVGGWSGPVFGEEQRQVPAGRAEVLRVQGTQHRIRRHPVREAIDEGFEER
jgi:hypothetical protein